MNRSCAIVASGALLSACASSPPEPKVVTQTVNVPVPVSCVSPALPGAPTYTDTQQALKAAPDMADRYQLLAGNYAIRVSRLQILEAVVDACRTAAK